MFLKKKTVKSLVKLVDRPLGYQCHIASAAHNDETIVILTLNTFFDVRPINFSIMFQKKVHELNK